VTLSTNVTKFEMFLFAVTQQVDGGGAYAASREVGCHRHFAPCQSEGNRKTSEQVLVGEVGVTLAETARYLGVSTSAVSKSLMRQPMFLARALKR
jgi:hypothetical protein